MSAGRVVSSLVASVAVAGCAVVVFGMSHAASTPAALHRRPTPAPSETSRPATLPQPSRTSAGSSTVRAAREPAATKDESTAAAPAGTTAVASTVTSTPSATVRALPAAATTTAPSRPAPVTTAVPVASTPHAAAPARGVALPLHYSTGSATRVITVTAPSTGSTVATVQPWTKMPGGGWRKQGSAITAHIGADGMSTHPSESRSATPIGSFTLTQAFGYDSNPGTTLPYFTTTLADFWISTEGPVYNTHQRCSTCGYNNGINEQLATETPYYNYAVVIDYNTRNAPGGVHAGAGSAFFLHVYPPGTGATAGCVAIPQNRLVAIMRWLHPGNHPRILIGVT